MLPSLPSTGVWRDQFQVEIPEVSANRQAESTSFEDEYTYLPLSGHVGETGPSHPLINNF